MTALAGNGNGGGRRPTCKWTGCHEESTTRCCFHKKEFCTKHADDHDDGHHCYFRASAPLRLQPSGQLKFQF